MTRDANAPGARSSLGLIRGLDGIRAMSVLAIIGFHTGLKAVPGGFYGVDAFFVLSGFLITSLLLKEWGSTGTVRLRHFWARRARRLLPALFLLIAVIGIVTTMVPGVFSAPHTLGTAIATVFYASNWYSIHNGATYFTLTQQQSPLLHTWSLAIEEQFYLVWPLVVLGVLKLGTARKSQARRDPAWTRRRRLHVLLGLACVGALASAFDMARLAPDGYTTRAYYGTDTRAQALLVGAAIAIGLTLWREASRQMWFIRLAAALGLAGAAGTAAIWTTTTENSAFAFNGGFLLMSLAAGCVVLCAAVAPKSPVVRLLELPPLPWLGRISYGIYLWYWPVLLVMSPERLHWGVYPLFLARVAVTVSIAAISYELVEMPIRRGVLRQRPGWGAAPLGATVAISAVFVGSLVPVGAAELQGSAMNLSHVTNASTLPLLSPPVPSTATTKPVKVLLVGDSLAGSLGVGLTPYASKQHVQIVNEGIPSCSLSMQTQFRVLTYSVTPSAPCDAGNNPNSLLDVWRQWVDTFNPDVVVYLARGETFDQRVDGQWENAGQPSFDSYLESRYQQAVKVLGSRGAAVVLMATPYFDSSLSGNGGPWPEDDPTRAQVDNATMRSVAEAEDAGTTAAGPKVYVFDLNALVSPANRYVTSVGGINVRCADGVHFSQSGGLFVGVRLVPELAALGEAHATSTPGGAWAGPLPPSSPSWIQKLLC